MRIDLIYKSREKFLGDVSFIHDFWIGGGGRFRRVKTVIRKFIPHIRDFYGE